LEEEPETTKRIFRLGAKKFHQQTQPASGEGYCRAFASMPLLWNPRLMFVLPVDVV